MEFNYKLLSINKVDHSVHTVMTGLKEKDALNQMKNLVVCSDPNEPIMYALDKYIPVQSVKFGEKKS